MASFASAWFGGTGALNNLSQSPQLPRTQAGREPSCFIIHMLQSLEPSVSCARAKRNINPSFSMPRAITAAPSTRTLGHLDLRVHRDLLGSCQNANSGSGGLRHELSFCVSDKFPGQRPQRIATSQSREFFKDRSMPRA